ncbi:helicase-associated domain-containing protein, partial [Cellulomonas oligotrophica]|uniref:helicase-associated domain-containing protein n=1 Tax=Cellulomonas oligotrophica TaxID=931536 RepID=UPI0031EC1AD2
MPSFSGWLRACDDDALVALLTARPDLASPSPATLASLAARATSRASLERALAGLDALVLQVLESVVVLGDAPPTPDDVARAVGAGASDAPAVADAAGTAVRLALLHPDEAGRLHAAPGLADVLGTHVAGLAPADPASDDAVPADPAAALADAPAGAAQVLDALTWGPPVGRVPPAGCPGAQAVRALVAHGLLARPDAEHVVLPRTLALRLRDGRTHRAPAAEPAPASPVRPAATVAAESTAAAERTVRQVRRLLQAWEDAPPPVLRAGGLGVRDLRRTAQTLEVDEPHAAWLVELAAAAGLLADDGEERPAFVPTVDADVWAAGDVPRRWALLARAWLASPRTPWQVGTRDEKGGVRAALDPELARPWVPRLRRAVLEVLAAGAGPGAAPDADAVLAVLAWRTPRAVPPRGAVQALLTEAEQLGVTGAGALSRAGRALLDAADDAGRDDAAAALAADLPAPVDEILLQGDLTGVVPGRPGDALEELLETAAQVESRGGAVTVRFTPASVLAALDGGLGADALLDRLAAVARGGVPQPLEYLVRDVARRHGRVRAGAASAYVRADDPALLAGLPDDPRLAGLGLRLLAPTVLVAQAGPAEVLDALRRHGLAPVAEDGHGVVVPTGTAARRVRGRAATRARRRVQDGAVRE